jgi:hypothetical protein
LKFSEADVEIFCGRSSVLSEAELFVINCYMGSGGGGGGLNTDVNCRDVSYVVARTRTRTREQDQDYGQQAYNFLFKLQSSKWMFVE